MHSRCRLTPYPVAIPPGDLAANASLQYDGLYFAMLSQWSGNASDASAQYIDAVIQDRDHFPYCGAGDVNDAVRALTCVMPIDAPWLTQCYVLLRLDL